MFSKAYQYIRAFSIDVVAGAAISARWVGNYFEADFSTSSIIALSLTVWLIYTLDHLLDARRVKSKKAIFRHLIHKNNAPYIIGVMLVVSMVLLYTILQLDENMIWLGIILGLLVAIYFAYVHYLQKKPYWGKEWFIALVYASGICLPTIAYSSQLSWQMLYFWGLFFILASINLLIFNMFELKQDKAQGFVSFSTVWGFDISRRVILALFVLFIVIWSGSFLFIQTNEFLDYQAIFILMGSVLAIILSKEQVMKHQEWYRVFGDIVFVLPIIELMPNVGL